MNCVNTQFKALTASGVIPGKILNTPILELILVWTLNLVAWFSLNSSSHSTTKSRGKMTKKLEKATVNSF